MPKRGDNLQSRLLATFRTEAREHLDTIGNRLSALKAGVAGTESRIATEEVFRAFHTLKGAARSVSVTDVERAAQACESILSEVSRGHTKLTREVLKELHEAVTAIERLLGGERADSASEVAALPEAAGVTPPDSLRLSTEQLDALLVRAEDFVASKLSAGERVREAAVVVQALEGIDRALADLPRKTPGNGSRSEAPDAELKAAKRRVRELTNNLREDERTLAAGVGTLQRLARGLRMSPAAKTVDALPGMIKDLGKHQRKEIEFAAEGTTLEIDRRVLEAIKDPLIHLVRNAVDHGIEEARERARAEKPRNGKVSVRFTSLEGGRIEISVSDDGAGIDPDRVKAAAVRLRQLTQQEAQALAPEDAVNLVFRSGISTAPMITALSGHGLGLAIVRERVERLGGDVHLQTAAGRGTTVRMVVPASITTFSGLLLRASERPFLIGTDAVERVTRIAQEEIRSVEGRHTIFVDGRPMVLVSLATLLGLPVTDGVTNDTRTCVIVAGNGERMGLTVDEIVGEREVVVKELRAPLMRVRHIAGAGLLGSGELVLILRPADLLHSRFEPLRAVPARERITERVPRILVVDDSITTRTMEKNLLEAAGYHVQVAVDGAEAWTALKSQKFDLVLSDVDMPRIDGFELTRRIRADHALSELPVVLVTALESREDKERGIEVGANAYVVKSSFDQSNLLEILRRLS